MNRRELIRTIGFGAAACAIGALALPGCSTGTSGHSSGVPTKKNPNFLFILADDLGWSQLSCYGSGFYETPNVDRLAGESMRFTDAYTACPVCSPIRASIMTGRYPARLHLTDFIAGGNYPNEKYKQPKWQKSQKD